MRENIVYAKPELTEYPYFGAVALGDATSNPTADPMDPSGGCSFSGVDDE